MSGAAWLSVAEAERLSGRRRRTLRRYAQQGKLQLRYAADGSVEYLASDVAMVATPTPRGHPPHKQTADAPSVEILATPDHPDDQAASPAQMAHQVGMLRGQLLEVRADRDQWRDLAQQYLDQARAAERDLAELRGGQVATEQTTPVATPGQPSAKRPRRWWRFWRR